MDESLKVDVRAMQERGAELSRGIDNIVLWSARPFLTGLLFGLALFFGLPALQNGQLPSVADFTSRTGLFRIVMAVLFAASGVFFRYRNVRKLTTGSPEDLAATADKTWQHLVGPQWVGRTLKTGMFLALGIGIPIGLLIAFAPSLNADQTSGGRALAVLGFVAITAAWTFPMAFILRFVSIRAQRKFMYDPASRNHAAS